MDIREILKKVDHTLLGVTAGWSDIEQILIDAEKFGTASACIPPAFVKRAKDYVGDRVKICTVIGFPHGAHATQIKVDEARLALDQGCEELDMVINIGEMIRGNEAYVQDEIKQICDLAHSRNAIVKVILETCYLTDAQKKRCCELSEAAGADFVKTSTGYGTKGCTIDDLKLMRASVSDHVRVKGSGGIRDLDTVLAARAAGASRCGVSATEKIMAEAEARYREGKL